MSYTNNTGVSLLMAVWLVNDDYDHDDRSNYISVTTLIKSVRQIVLAARVKPDDAPVDIVSLAKSRIGQAIHTAIERAWKDNFKSAMALLNYPKKVIDRIEINPVSPGPDTLAVYIEQRVERDFGGVLLGGKYDMIILGKLSDVKSTSVWSYINGSSIGKWKLQGSIYRLLNQDKVTDDHLFVQYVFTDWSGAAVGTRPGYPATPILELPVPLLSVSETERYINNKLQELRQHWNAPEMELPLCTDEDLWRDPPVYKYYAGDPKLAKKSTKNFDNMHDANAHRSAAGKGVIVPVPGIPRACTYCKAFNLCSQKNQYF